LTAIPTNVTAKTTIRMTKMVKGLSMTLFHQSFRQVEDRSQRRPATHGSTLESKPGAAVAARVLLSAVRIVDNDTTFS
jgi:hypothetical protein